jgi:hypothetical protein
VESLELVERLAGAEIGETYNQYADSALRQKRLCDYIAARADAEIVLVGEAAGYRGARISGVPFTSERQLSGSGLAEATATIVHRVLAKLGVGRLAAAVLDAPYVRHPSHGGAAEFEEGLERHFATIRRRRAPVRPFS